MKIILGLFVLLSSSISFAGPVLTYQGRILKPDGSPVKTPTSFTISITNPSGSCELWAEPFSSSMSGGDGSFSFVIGAGTRSDAGTKEFKDIFSDGVIIAPNSSCSAGYTKLSSDILKLKIRFDDGTGPQSLPTMDITAVPFAIEAQKVAGVASENVVRVSDGAVTPLSSSSFSELLTLLNGTSSKYLKNDVSSGASLPKMTSDPSGLGPSDAGNIIYRSDTKEIKFWDGTSFQSLGSAGGSGITSITAGTGLTGGTINSSGQTIAVDLGLTATKVPRVGASNITANQVIVADGAASGLAGKSLIDGELLIGSTGAAPVVTTLTAGAGVSITNGPGSITISSSGSAPAGVANGDLSANYPNPTVSKINGVSVSTAVAGDNGKFLKYESGTGWLPRFVKLSDLMNGTGTGSAFSIASCSAKETLAWSSLTDQFTCQPIGTLDAGAITTGVLSPARGGSKWSSVATTDIYYNTGKVGIGNDSPSANLDVAGTVKIADGSQGADKVLTSDAAGNATWKVPTGGWVVAAQASNLTVTTSHKGRYFLATGTITFTLPSAATAGNGFVVAMKSNVAGGIVTIIPDGAEKINNQSNLILEDLGASAVLISDGSNWHVLSSTSADEGIHYY